jgi:O-antigen/teichoic acid export membrane protein
MLGPGIVLTGLLVWVTFSFNITPAVILILSLISMLLVLFVFSRRLNARYTGTKKLPGLSIRDALPFVLVSTLILLNQRVDIIFLGILRSQDEVGLYTVASKGSELVNYILIVVNTVIGSHLAARYKAGDFQGMQTLLTASIRRAFIITCIPAFAMIFAGSPILGFLFGDEYTAASIPLAILAFAQLLNVGAGSVAMILNMTGGEKVVALGVGFAVILNTALNFILIPLFSINGAAIATGISLVAWNFILVLAVRKRLDLRPTVLGI